MKLNLEPVEGNADNVAGDEAKTTHAVIKPGASAEANGLESFRRLKPNEVVSPGDFVKNGREGFEPWEGPNGFRAASFVKPIYRRQ